MSSDLLALVAAMPMPEPSFTYERSPGGFQEPERVGAYTADQLRSERLKAAQLVLAQQDPEGSDLMCPRCDGSGGEIVMSDNGPDAYEQTIDCAHCNGKGSLYHAYHGLCALLESERKVKSELSSRLWGLASAPDFFREFANKHWPRLMADAASPVLAQGEPVAWRYRYDKDDRWRVALAPAPQWAADHPEYEEEPLFAAPAATVPVLAHGALHAGSVGGENDMHPEYWRGYAAGVKAPHTEAAPLAQDEPVTHAGLSEEQAKLLRAYAAAHCDWIISGHASAEAYAALAKSCFIDSLSIAAPAAPVNAEMLAALKEARVWLCGWASAERQLALIDAAIAAAERAQR